MNVGILTNRILLEFFTIITGLLLLFLHVFLLIICFPIFVYRYILDKAGRVFNPSLGRMVTARGQFLATENFTSGKSPRANIVTSVILKGYQDVSEIRRLVTNHMVNAKIGKSGKKLKYPELQQYVITWPNWFGFRFWKRDKNFKIENHVKEYQPCSPVHHEDLRNWMETLLNEPFQPNISPWQMFVTNNFVNPEISDSEMLTVVIKTHHCLSDGYGLLHTLVESFEKEPPTYPKANFTQRGTLLEQMSFHLKFPFLAIYKLAKFATLTFQDHPWKVTDEKKAWKQLFWNSPIIPVQKIKVIKNRFRVSFASVLHAACAAACREMMLNLKRENQTNSQFEKGEYSSSIVSNLGLSCAIIVPLPNHPKILRNHCAGVYVHLPVGHCDPTERLVECEQQIIKSKNSPQPFLGKILPKIGGGLITSLTKAFGPNRQLPMGISIFPISIQKVYKLYDREVVHMEVAAGAQVGVAGVNVFIRTYNEGVQFSMTAENSIMSHENIRKTINLMLEEIDTLYKMSLV